MRVARMIIVDAALKAREAAGNPVRVAMIGAGFMARDVAIANRHLEGAQRAHFLGSRAARASVA